jgi:hypothetical protein
MPPTYRWQAQNLTTMRRLTGTAATLSGASEGPGASRSTRETRPMFPLDLLPGVNYGVLVGNVGAGYTPRHFVPKCLDRWLRKSLSAK